MNYRKYYEKMCNLKIPKGFVIHHIDFNRANNNIENLVMLPSYLHRQYHYRLNDYKLYDKPIETKMQGLQFMGYDDYFMSEKTKNQKAFLKVWRDCAKYVTYRDYRLGKFPFHTFEIGFIEEEINGNI